MSVLRVLSPGLHTTVQDLGRPGAQYLGVPVSGAIDAVSLRLANLLAGNGEAAGALEILMHGPSFEVAAESARLAVAGPGAGIELLQSGHLAGAKSFESTTLTRGDQFRVTLGEASSICYLAVEGGFAIPPVMGSQSTFVRGGLGGFMGRPLKKGDEVPLNRTEASSRAECAISGIAFPSQTRFRIMLGPQDDYFTPEAIEAFLAATFTVSHHADRMGFRLSGFALQHSGDFNIVSDGTAPGAIQVPGSGEPIVLLADRQTTGGYPKIGVVISADLPALGRLRPGRQLSFRAVDYDEARNAAGELNAWFSKVKSSIREITARPAVDIGALFEQNLIDGVVDAKVPLVD